MILERAWIDDLKIHDVADLAAIAYALSSCDLASSPEPRVSTTPRSRAHGSINRTRFWQARLVQLVGWCEAGGIAPTQTAIDELKRRLRPSTGPHVLKFRRLDGFEDERLVVQLATKFDAPLAGYQPIVKWGVTLEAPDPRIYSDTVKNAAYDPTTSGDGGLDFPLTFPLSFASGGAAYLEVENNGTEDTPPIFTITGPGTLTAIDNDTTGESIYFTGAGLGAGEQLVIDVAARAVVYAGASAPELIDGRLTTWLELTPGQNLLRLRGAGFVAAATELAVTFRDARS